jgi:hypothetical protein
MNGRLAANERIETDIHAHPCEVSCLLRDWTSQHFAGMLGGMNDAAEPLSPVGQVVEPAREKLRISKREAARRAGISEGRWRQVVTGIQKAGGGVDIPVRPRAETVIAMLAAVELQVLDAFIRMGGEAPPPNWREIANGVYDRVESPPTPADDLVARRQALARDDALIDSIWASELSDQDKLELVQIVIDERTEALTTADRRARERFAERLRWRRQQTG